MKLNLNFDLKDLDGKAIPEGNIAKVLANILVRSESSDPMKIMTIATALYQKGEVELDASDVEKLKEEINKQKGMTTLLKAKILEQIQGLKV